jgi:hypothetical protein
MFAFELFVQPETNRVVTRFWVKDDREVSANQSQRLLKMAENLMVILEIIQPGTPHRAIHECSPKTPLRWDWVLKPDAAQGILRKIEVGETIKFAIHGEISLTTAADITRALEVFGQFLAPAAVRDLLTVKAEGELTVFTLS